MMDYSYQGSERRKHKRVPKSLNLFFYEKDSPGKKLDETLIKDISKGGVRFTTSHPLKPNTQLIFEIAVPYIAPKRLILEGLVISSKEITPGLVYEIRGQFYPMDERASLLLDMIEKRSLKG